MELKADGIFIKEVNNTNSCIFAKYPYYYSLLKPNKSDILNFDLPSYCLYVLSSSILIKEYNIVLNKGDMIQVENTFINYEIFDSTTEILVSGIYESYTKEKITKIIREKEIYKVNKPWGYELWINGEHPKYVLKRVMIKVGNRTSLQYHKYKRETNVIFNGIAKFHFKKDSVNKNIDDVILDDIETVKIFPITSVDVSPLTLHRVEALTDIILYETSTSYLDDVIRIHDDSLRTSGRILEEHKGER